MRERDGEKLVRFAQTFGRITRGSQAGQPLVLRPWQVELVSDLAASGAREAYIQLPRKNGKSAIGSVLALHGLCADGEPGAEVYSVAGTRDQARIVFEGAKRMVELGPLAKSLTCYRNEIVHRPSGSRYKALAAEAGAHEGLNPSLVIFDEVHVLGSRRELWDVMRLGMGTREHPLLLGITTPGVMFGRDGRDSLARSMYQYGKNILSGQVIDEDFFFRCWEAPESCDVEDRDAWHVANPGLGDFLAVGDMESAARTTPENEFRTKRLGQWVVSHTAWLPTGAWEGCEALPAPERGTAVVLGFDGSKSRDATALVGATIEPSPQVFVVKVWERPHNAPMSWQVPRDEVEAAVIDATKTWDVREMASDPSLWLSELQSWASQGVPVVEYPQSPSRMVPATQRLYEAVVTGELRHDGANTLARHIGNAVVRPNGQIGKEHKDSGRKVDAAVAAIMAYDRAAILGASKRRKAIYVV
jgi:phage terminase large subunit-like protein